MKVTVVKETNDILFGDLAYGETFLRALDGQRVYRKKRLSREGQDGRLFNAICISHHSDNYFVNLEREVYPVIVKEIIVEVK